MLAFIRTPASMLRGLVAHSMSGQAAEKAQYGELIGPNVRFDEIFNSAQRKSDKDVMDSVLSQL